MHSTSPVRRNLFGHSNAEKAAIIIQKNYRGYRARRQLVGLGLDAPTRWNEAIKELRYRASTVPLAPQDRLANIHEHAQAYWRRAKEVALHAASEDASDTDGEEEMTQEQLEAYRKKRIQAKEELEKAGKLMDLQYWLEMVDRKHRYGANLRVYHNFWKKSDTNQNFFYWLDEGDGKMLELPSVSRKTLEDEQVRYLSKEERQMYLVRVDSEGRLCWAKNKERITTSPEFKDSLEGVVPITSDIPTWHAQRANERPLTQSSGGSSASEESRDAPHYDNEEYKKLTGFKRLTKASPAVIFNHLMQKTIRPDTWIYVADTSFHLYIGIKQSGTFQHSSFLQGARIASAGLIRIKDGQIRKLSPLSGHYRPPTKNFRLFISSLHDSGVDMSHAAKSKSYAMLAGLEAYARVKQKLKTGLTHLTTKHPHDSTIDEKCTIEGAPVTKVNPVSLG